MRTFRQVPRRLWHLVRCCTVLLLAAGLSGCGDGGGLFSRLQLKPGEIIVERRPDPRYDILFPYYVELCSISQWHDKLGRRGNPFGHALIYIKGACKDEAAPFPLLRRCRGLATSTDDPEHGAAVSVGQWLRNVNFIVVPGHDLVFSGNLETGERLTREHRDATVQEAIAKGVYQGVEFHDGWTREADRSLTNFVTRHSVGVDFALQFSRNVFCSRIPVPEPVLDEIIAFLNDKNTEYATGKADYNWNLLADNCVHTVRNALAAANIWAPIPAWQVTLRALFELAVPANEFVNLGALGAKGPLADYREIQGNGPSRDALHDFRWLPTRHGALVKTLPVHQPNDVYRTDFRLFAVQSPLRMGKTAGAVRLLSDPRYVELEPNLLHFRDEYDRILATHDYRVDPLASVRGTPYRRVGRVHLQYIGAQRAEVEGLLQKLKAYNAVPGAPKGETAPLGDAFVSADGDG
ncbi:MAG: hypothetical protein MUE49_14205 [Rhodospirillales bacterium]|nr:hypothetical protein [Rhodospirillales bacterium]